jgi:Tol biopolymer transport system component
VTVYAAQLPLPRLLYGEFGSQSLSIWEADCPSLLVFCQHERRLLEGMNSNPVTAWSPDGAYIAVYMTDAWMIYPAACLLNDSHCQPIPLDSAAIDTRVAWGPSGSTIAYMTNESNTSLRIRTRGCWDGSPAYNCLTHDIELASSGALRQPAWSADGSRFAFLGYQPQGLFVLDAACLDDSTGCTDHISSVLVDRWPVYWPSLSGDGEKLLYFAEMPDGVEQLYMTNVDGSQTEQISFRSDGGSVPAWSSDERYVAFAGLQKRTGGDWAIYILDMQRRLIVRAIGQRGQDLAYPAWSPQP